MQRAIRPDWLLRQADELAYREQGAGQPRNANLRRAVSSAYYGLFHAVTLATAQQLLPGGTEEERWRLARAINHADIRQVCEWILSANKGPAGIQLLMGTVRGNVALLDVALAFQILQDARHAGDYDHLADFSKAAVLTLIDQARDAVTKLQTASGTPDLQRFVSAIALRQTLR